MKRNRWYRAYALCLLGGLSILGCQAFHSSNSKSGVELIRAPRLDQSGSPVRLGPPGTEEASSLAGGPEDAIENREAPPFEELASTEMKEEASGEEACPTPVPPEAADTSQPTFMDLTLNKSAQGCLKLFLSSVKRDRVAQIVNRSTLYAPIIKQYFKEEGIPEEIAYLSGIESGFSANAVSKVGAVGWWQFMSATGRRYGLRIDSWVDERRDLEKSTRAAARYLKNLHKMFGCWMLAMASYNVGENAVAKAIQKQGTKDYWSLKLPQETMSFVPSYIAMHHLCLYAERYGMTPVPVPFTPEAKVTVGPYTNLRTLAECAGTTYEVIKGMNPHLLKGCTPPDRDAYEVKIPATGYEGFADRLAKVKESHASQYFRHRVKAGDSLSAIASRYGTTVEEIVRFNGLRNSNRIVVGDQLMIPGLSAPQESESSAPAPIEVAEKSTPSSSIHVVRRGENLWSIAQAYGLSLESMASANGIKKSKTLYPGEKLKVPGRGVVQQEQQKVSVKVYKVKEGDTIWGIAKAGNTSIQKIQEANNLGPNDVLMPGDILKIPVSSTK